MLLPVMEKGVKKILDAKNIVPLRYSKWVVNLVPVRKKNGEIRLCVDFQILNRSSKKDNYPLPKMEHILQRVTGVARMSMMMVFLVTTRFLFSQRIERRRLLPLFGVHSCTPRCPLV
jgi:hypothetical protein